MKIIAIATPLLGLALVGCLPPDPNVGKGPITLSPQAQQNFEEYKTARSPGYFVVTEDGLGSFYNYCSSGRCYRTSSNEVIHRCEENAGGRACKVYASKGKVVWQEEVEPEAIAN
ncbi:MAG: hypothetical protein ACR2RA_13270 [Geminicoccaceae bacterium]